MKLDVKCDILHLVPNLFLKNWVVLFSYIPQITTVLVTAHSNTSKKTKEMEVLNIAHLLTVNPKKNDRPSGSYSPLCFRGCQNPVTVGSIFYTFLVKGILINFTMNQCFRRAQQDGPCLTSYWPSCNPYKWELGCLSPTEKPLFRQLKVTSPYVITGVGAHSEAIYPPLTNMAPENGGFQ